MRKLAVVLVILIALGGAYTYYWNKQAHDFEAGVKDFIDQQNAIAKPYLKDTPLIRYSGITTSGFPLAMQVSVINPVMEVPASAFLEAYIPAPTPAPANAAPPQSLVLEIAYNGPVTLTSNLWADDFSLSIPADSTITSKVNNEAKKPISSTLASAASCHLAIENQNNLPWTLPQSFASSNAFLGAFRSFDCDLPGIAVKSDSGELLSSADDLSLFASSRPVDEENYMIAFTFTGKNVKALPAYDVLLNTYAPLFYDALHIPQEQRSPINVSQYGEQNSHIDISYEGPLDRKYLADTSANVNFDIAALDFKNALYDTSTRVHFSTATHSNQRESILRIHSSFDANELYEQFIAKKLSALFAEIAQSPIADIKFTTDVAALNKPDELAAVATPKFKTLGAIKFDADINVSNDKDKNMLDDGTISIHSLNLTVNPYGLAIKGDGKAAGTPTGEVFATFMLCDDMVTGVGNYLTAIDSLLATARPRQVHYVTPQLIEGAKQFLHALNENADKNSKDVIVHVIMNDKGLTISGKQLLEVLGLYDMNITQNLPQTEQPAQKKPQAKPTKKKTKS